ncbi:radial spoke head 14 homolog [Copidosoma floridanum]|uniref:radial spoke head 14 homolog n=1 Tax=Copidosoma floridanum TaxID=29053 RepID=UPI0006C99285|nr:radial spoke head 14 homolog [Copidosoma floridanum]
MYPHPKLNSFLQTCNPDLSAKILDRVVERGYVQTLKTEATKSKFPLSRLRTAQPQCFAPDVDVTRSKCAFGPYALPQLKKELENCDPLIVRQAVTTLGDLLIDPAKSIEAIGLGIVDELSSFLVSKDPYLRERVAMIYSTIANQNAGRTAITENFDILSNLLKALGDKFAAVRLKVALAVETLAQEPNAADLMITCGFLEVIVKSVCEEKKEVLIVHLDTLRWLTQRDAARAIEDGLFEKLASLLENVDEERVLRGALICMKNLCECPTGKQRANDADLLKTLKRYIYDKREHLLVEAVRVASFVTITTKGKLRALELEMMNRLLYLATGRKKKGCRCCGDHDNDDDDMLLLAILKTVTNIAEAPEARKQLFQEYQGLIENLDVGESELLHRHRQILLDVVRWRP